jgi:hypothetical protein
VCRQLGESVREATLILSEDGARLIHRQIQGLTPSQFQTCPVSVRACVPPWVFPERHRSSSTQPSLRLPRRPPRRSRHAAQARAPTPNFPGRSRHAGCAEMLSNSLIGPARRRGLGVRTAACRAAAQALPGPAAAVLVRCGALLSPAAAAGLARCGVGRTG